MKQGTNPELAHPTAGVIGTTNSHDPEARRRFSQSDSIASVYHLNPEFFRRADPERYKKGNPEVKRSTQRDPEDIKVGSERFDL